jgi:pyruvate dehydrogenase E1 component alpha subunit
MAIPRDTIVPLLRTMLLMRRTEEAVCEMAEEFPGNFHVYVGQEATGASVISLLRPDEMVFTTHRNHAHNVARGVPPEQVLGEILGKSTGPSGGKGGTFHVMSGTHKTVATAIVGGSTILATGAGLAGQVLKDGRIGVAFLGDRTLNEGAVYESFNLASLWNLPVLYVCENNVAPNDPRASNLTVAQLSDIARTFGIAADAVDATDPTIAYDAAVAGVDKVRTDQRPMFLETRTPRWPGNSGGGDPTLSITGATDISIAWAPPAEDPHEAWHRADPVLRLVRLAFEEEAVDQQSAKQLDREVREIVASAMVAARAAPLPAGEAAFADALSGGDLWPR